MDDIRRDVRQYHTHYPAWRIGGSSFDQDDDDSSTTKDKAARQVADADTLRSLLQPIQPKFKAMAENAEIKKLQGIPPRARPHI